LAARNGLGAHGIRIYEEDGQRWLELHLEVSDHLLLDEAHTQATEFERAIRENLPEIKRIITHIEPTGDTAATVQAENVGPSQVEHAIHAFLAKNSQTGEPHNLRVQQTGDGLSVSFHCRLAPTTAITEAHELTVRLEEYLRRRIPGLGRVVIHVEPAKPTSL
jgi:divalent metal cation (Fe/Co/Zn/Cd) transporter